MYLAVKQQLNNLSKDEYLVLRELCHVSKNLYNQALYEIRQEYFESKKYLSYYEVYKRLKNTENYGLLQAQVSQQTLKAIDTNFKSFFGLIKKKMKARIPKYLDKDGFFKLTIPTVSIKNDKIQLPYSRQYAKEHNKIYLKVPSVLKGKEVKQVWIVPRQNARFFEVQYIYKVEPKEKKPIKNALAVDLGITNLCTCVTSEGNSFIMDGRKLKSFNQWYNKETSRLKSIKDKQKIKEYTKKLYRIVTKRNNRVSDILHKSCKYIINYCIDNNIDTVVCGMNKDFQRYSNLGKVNNQKFTQIPFGKVRNILNYLCELNGINFIEQEESYTSKASFWDRDEIPVFSSESKVKYNFSGKRVHRGLYCSKNGKLLNADLNGSLNILRKSNVVSLEALYSRGVLNPPSRIMVA